MGQNPIVQTMQSEGRTYTMAENTLKQPREKIYDLLMNARQAKWVELDLEDGRSLTGAIIFNEFKGTGRLINVEEEVSFDFNVDQIVDVRI